MLTAQEAQRAQGRGARLEYARSLVRGHRRANFRQRQPGEPEARRDDQGGASGLGRRRGESRRAQAVEQLDLAGAGVMTSSQAEALQAPGTQQMLGRAAAYQLLSLAFSYPEAKCLDQLRDLIAEVNGHRVAQ